MNVVNVVTTLTTMNGQKIRLKTQFLEMPILGQITAVLNQR